MVGCVGTDRHQDDGMVSAKPEVHPRLQGRILSDAHLHIGDDLVRHAAVAGWPRPRNLGGGPRRARPPLTHLAHEIVISPPGSFLRSRSIASCPSFNRRLRSSSSSSAFAQSGGPLLSGTRRTLPSRDPFGSWRRGSSNVRSSSPTTTA